MVSVNEIGLLQITKLIEAVKKNDSDEVIVLGLHKLESPEHFVIAKNNKVDVLAAQLVMTDMCLGGKVVALDKLTITQFQSLLKNIGVAPSLVLNNVNDFALSIPDITIDEGAIFHDKEGNCLTVISLEDNRTLADMLKGDGEHSVEVKFSGSLIHDGGMSGQTNSISKIRDLIKSKELFTVF